jgi:hypothetical protein
MMKHLQKAALKATEKKERELKVSYDRLVVCRLVYFDGTFYLLEKRRQGVGVGGPLS